MAMINSSILVKYVMSFVSALISACNSLDSYCKKCFQTAWVSRIIIAAGRRLRAILIIMFRQSVLARVLRQWLVILIKYAEIVSVNIYEGSIVLDALERALVN